MTRRGFVREPLVEISALLLFVVLVVAVTALLGVASPRTARADQPGAHTLPVAVLAFDTDDSEEQADAITNALRSRVRAAQGWSLIETTQALGMLTAAYKCPLRPTLECQQKIAEQVKADRYIWGIVTKGPTAGQVTAEVHLYQRGKPDTTFKESYSENLKDGNDDTLRKIAARIVERLGGIGVGVIVVRSPAPDRELIVDGEKRVPLERGSARIELAAGGHSVELVSLAEGPGERPRGPVAKRNVTVSAGRETVVEFGELPFSEPNEPEGRSHTRHVVGGVMMGAGVVFGTVAVIELVHWLGLQEDGDARASELDKNTVNGDKPCREYDAKCSTIHKDSQVASGLAWGLGAGGLVALGVGAYLFFSDSNSNASEKSPTAATLEPKVRVFPMAGQGSGGLVMIGSF